MNDINDSGLDRILKQIEFPGEDGEKILTYLQSRNFTDRVMEQTRNLGSNSPKIAVWGAFTVLNLLLLLILGTNDFIVQDFFALRNALSQFFFLFLGFTLVGSLIGLILSVDTSWFERLIHR